VITCTLKLQLRPTQERQLRRWLWHLTGVYNWAIGKLEADAKAGIRYSVYDLKRLLNGHSRRMGIPAHALQGMAAQAHTAYQRYRDGISRRPRRKGMRNRLNSIPFDHGRDCRIRGQRVVVPGLGRVKFHRQEIPAGKIGQVRLVKRASGWYFCLFIQAEPAPIAAIADGQIGIDPGFARLLTTSEGEIVEHPNELAAGAWRLGQAQRGGRRKLTSRLFERQANRRKDRNHKLSRRLVAENRLIVWSKDRSAALARVFGKSVASAGHYQLRQQLAYKSRAGGREFIEVDSRNSTRTCSACRARTGPTGFAGLKVRQWVCACGAYNERDVNAARNTLLAGLGMSLERRREAASGIVNMSNTTKFTCLPPPPPPRTEVQS
jgi:transposase